MEGGPAASPLDGEEDPEVVLLPRQPPRRGGGTGRFLDELATLKVTCKKVRIREGVRYIDDYAFQGFKNLVSVIIPHGVTRVGTSSFCGTALQHVTIPDTVTEISTTAFEKCVQLRSVELPRQLERLGVASFLKCHSLESVVVHNVTRIQAHAFYDCTALKEVVFPPTLTEISQYAFQGCASLVRVDFPPTLTKLGIFAFAECFSLTDVELPMAVTSVGDGAFASCTSLVTAILPSEELVYEECGPPLDFADIAVFANCGMLQYVIAPTMISDVNSHFEQTPVLEVGGLVGDTPVTRHRAAALRFWSRKTHRWCSLTRREWVANVLMIAGRLGDQGLRLPPEMWLTILELIRRCELGPN